MAIYKRSGSPFWWYSVCRGRGKPRVMGSTGKVSRDEALAVEGAVKMAYRRSSPREKILSVIEALYGDSVKGLPLCGVWDAYAAWAAGVGVVIEDSTRRGRRRAVERFAEWAVSHWPSAVAAGSVTRMCAAAFAADLAEGGASAKTRRNVIGDLGTVWKGLRSCRDDVVENPWPLVLPKSGREERLEAFTRDEELRVMESAEESGWELACLIARHTGLRYGDVARLKWEAVDFGHGVIRLTPSKTKRKGICVMIPMCAALKVALRKARKTAGVWAREAVAGKSGKGAERAERCAGKWVGYVLPEHAKWYPKPAKGEMGAFADVLKKAGLDDGAHTFHSWRHTFRTRLSEAGVSDEIAKRLGGWTVDATAMRYDHDGRAKEMAEAVEKASVGACSANKEGKKRKAGKR